MEVRLQKYMADCGVASRRKCEEWILNGQVAVNDQVITELGTKVDPEKDVVKFRGKVLRMTQSRVTVMLHKPAGYVTTSKDQFGRPSVLDLVTSIKGVRLYPVGRLDYQTTGLLLLTNDGDLDYVLTHPSHRIPRVYEAVLKGTPTEEAIAKLEAGIDIGGGDTAQPAKVKVLASKEHSSRVEFTIYEGKNHEVRRMAAAIGCPVLNLRRLSFAGLELGNLQEGRFRLLTDEEVAELKVQAGPKKPQKKTSAPRRKES